MNELGPSKRQRDSFPVFYLRDYVLLVYYNHINNN